MLLLLSSYHRSLHKMWTYDKSQYLIYIVKQMSPSIVILEFSAVPRTKELKNSFRGLQVGDICD